MGKPILCLDFDGVIHSYASGWIEADFIPDPPVEGAFQFLRDALEYFDVRISSSRSSQEGGIRAMMVWMQYWAERKLNAEDANKVMQGIVHRADAWPKEKPSAFLTIDDRALTFDGMWPSIEALKQFKPWNKR